MTDNVQVETVDAKRIAIVRDHVNFRNISDKLCAGLGEVWEYLRSAELTRGRNVVVYWEPANGSLFLTDEGVPVEIGVEVGDDFVGCGEIVGSTTPYGQVATAAHYGPYDELPQVHGLIKQWCADNGREAAGTNWEIYGHWTEDPSQLRTDVVYLLK